MDNGWWFVEFVKKNNNDNNASNDNDNNDGNSVKKSKVKQYPWITTIGQFHAPFLFNNTLRRDLGEISHQHFCCEKSYRDSPDRVKNKKATIHPIMNNDSKCFQYVATVALNKEIKKNTKNIKN